MVLVLEDNLSYLLLMGLGCWLWFYRH